MDNILVWLFIFNGMKSSELKLFTPFEFDLKCYEKSKVKITSSVSTTSIHVDVGE